MRTMLEDTKKHIALLEKRVKENPLNKNPYYYLGQLYEMTGDDKKAKQNYLDYLVRDIGFGDAAKAVDFLEKETRQNPDNCMALVNLGQIYCYLNRFDEAEELLKKGTSWEVFESPHYDFFVIRDSYAFKELEQIRMKWEENYKKIVEVFDERFEIKISYFFYESPVHKGLLTGDQEPGHCLPGKKEVHIVYNEKFQVSGLHEDCHAVLHHIGDPLKLFDEGTALYLEHGDEMHTRFREMLESAYPIAELLDDRTFESKDLFVVYPQVGSFVGFLWETYGFQRVRQACRTTHANPMAVVENTFGKPVAALEKEWLEFVGNR